MSRLPTLTPFTSKQAADVGLTAHHLLLLRDAGLVVTRLRGVHHEAGVVDSIELRLACLGLVVPEGYVVVDRTAAWLWGATMALAPGDHLAVPPISLFAPPGRRLRNKLASSGERRLSSVDVAALDGMLVTTPLRTACDLGRLLHRDQALGGMDALASLGTFVVDELVLELERFKGFRGIVQARVLAAIVDPASASPLESAGRLRWYDAGLPRPECQVDVPSPTGGSFYLDIGLRESRFGAELFGEEFHGEDRREHDEVRLEWICAEQQWTVTVARGPQVYGRRQTLEDELRRAWSQHRRAPRPGVLNLSPVRDGVPTRTL